MKSSMYSLYALALGIVAFFTGEIITFIMLGFILMALMTINANLKQLIDKEERND